MIIREYRALFILLFLCFGTLWWINPSIASGESASFDIDLNVNRGGSDITSFSIPNNDLYACVGKCRDNAKCAAFTYVKPGIQGSTAKCWLKSSVPAKKSDACCISGVKKHGTGLYIYENTVSEEGNADFPGNDYKSIALDAPDVRLCKNMCGADSKCRAYTYVKPGVQGPAAVCYLKKTVSNAKSSSCCASGVKESSASDLGDVDVEPYADRPGIDYKHFDLSQPNPLLCAQECKKDTNCRAYTYVKAGVQGPLGRCWLKSAVPQRNRSSCCVSGIKVPDSGQSLPLTKGAAIKQQKSCKQTLAEDVFNKICDTITPNVKCEITTQNCSNMTRQLYVGSTFSSSTLAEIKNWDKLGGRGKLLSEGAICALRDLSPELEGAIETGKSASTALGELSYKQRIGFLDFDQSKLNFDGYRQLSFCAPVVGCYDAVAQDLQVKLDKYSVSPQLTAGPGGPRLDRFYVLNMTTETSNKGLLLEPPAITIATPVGPVSVQPAFNYGSRESVIMSPFKDKNNSTLRISNDEPAWLLHSLHRDIYGVDYGIAFPTLMYRPTQTTGWDSPFALGNRDPTSNGQPWSPGGQNVVRPDRDLTKARSDEEKKPSVEMIAKARATYPDAGSLASILPDWLTGLGGDVSLSIFVEPTARAAFSSEFSLIPAEAAVPPKDIGAGGIRSASDLSIRTATDGTFEFSVLTGLDLTVKFPIVGTIVDTHPRWPINILATPSHRDGEQAYFASSDGPWIGREPLGYTAFKTFKTNVKTGVEAKSAYSYVKACLADKQLESQSPPEPHATPGDVKKLFSNAEWPCNICVSAKGNSGYIFGADRPSTAKQWTCDMPSKSGCYDICTMNPVTRKLVFKQSPDSSLKFENGTNGDKCYATAIK